MGSSRHTIAITSRREMASSKVTVLGAGYSGLTTAAELTLRGFKTRVVAADLGFRPPLTIVGTQSRRWPGSAISNTTFNNDDLLDRELVTIARFIALSSKEEKGKDGFVAVENSGHGGAG